MYGNRFATIDNNGALFWQFIQSTKNRIYWPARFQADGQISEAKYGEDRDISLLAATCCEH